MNMKVKKLNVVKVINERDLKAWVERGYARVEVVDKKGPGRLLKATQEITEK